MIKDLVKNIDVVLVEPRSAGNVGSVARVMANTGLKNMVLVNPCDLSPGGVGEEAYRMACKASSIFERARLCESLPEAIKSSVLVAATTRRRGKLRYPTLTLSEATPRILDAARSGPVSLVFGREDKGLTREEVSKCGMVVEIPSHSGYPSLNLSHAVFAVCHALYTGATEPSSQGLNSSDNDYSMEAVTTEELEGMYAHLEELLRALGYAEKGADDFLIKSIMHNFRRLFGRTTLMERELNMLRGIFKRMQGRL